MSNKNILLSTAAYLLVRWLGFFFIIVAVLHAFVAEDGTSILGSLSLAIGGIAMVRLSRFISDSALSKIFDSKDKDNATED